MLGRKRGLGDADVEFDAAPGSKRNRAWADNGMPDPSPNMDVDADEEGPPIGRAHSASLPLPSSKDRQPPPQSSQQIVLYQPKAERWSLAGLMQELSPALKRRDDGTMGVDGRMLHRIVSRLPPEAQQRVEAAWRQVVDLYHVRGSPLPNVHSALPLPLLPPIVITDVSDGHADGGGCAPRDPSCVIEEVDSEERAAGDEGRGSMDADGARHQPAVDEQRLAGEDDAMDVD